MEALSRACIELYLQKYQIKMEYNKEKNSIPSCIIYYKIELFHMKKSNIKFGEIKYSIHKDMNILEIDDLYIDQSKPDVPIKLTKIILLYLLSLHQEITKVTLNANPAYGKQGTEFCLLCFYYELGFTPTYENAYEFNITNLTNKCLGQLEEGDYYNKPSECILCKCQRQNISFSDLDFSRMQVEMSVLIPRMKQILAETYIDICK